jgi:SAM-dependent methyltransferase
VDVFLSEADWQTVVRRVEAERDEVTLYRRARREAPLNVQYYGAWVGRLWDLVPAGCRAVVAELMCGEAEIGRRLPADVGACLGVDLNVRLVEEAAEYLRRGGDSRARVVCASADRLPLADGSVGAVLIQGGLHHARPLLARIVREVARVLAPGGVVVGSEPANDALPVRLVRRWQYRRSSLQGKDEGEDGLTRAELAAALAGHGLRLESYRPFGYLAYPLMGNTDLLPLLARSRSRALGRALLAADRCLECVPGLRRLGWASLFRARQAAAQPAARRAG